MHLHSTMIRTLLLLVLLVGVDLLGGTIALPATASSSQMIPVRYTYTCQWQGHLVGLHHVRNQTVEGFPMLIWWGSASTSGPLIPSTEHW
jgi:hypothetical protein